MAPEQARAGEPIDARADVFALGCVLFQCLTGVPPFDGDTTAAILAKIPDPDHKTSFLEHVPENARTLALGERVGVARSVRAYHVKSSHARSSRSSTCALASASWSTASAGYSREVGAERQPQRRRGHGGSTDAAPR